MYPVICILMEKGLVGIMQYYITPAEPADWESLLIGEESFGTFYSEWGLDALIKIIEEGHEDQIILKDDHNNEWQPQDFVDHLNTLRIKKN